MSVAATVAMAMWVAAAPPVGNAPIPEVLKELYAIMGASQKGAQGELRIKYGEMARARPADPLPRLYLAWCDIPSDDSWNQLKAVGSINPDNNWVHLGMGQIYASWKMRDQAKAELDLALKADPKFYPALTQQGEIAYAAGDTAAAQKYYQQSLAIGDDPRAHTGMGVILLGLGNTAEAKTALEKGIKGWPDQPKALKALVKLYGDAGQKAEAAGIAARLADLAPKDRDARKMVADLRFDLGEKAEAAKEYERLLRLGDPSKEVLQRLSGLYRELGNAEAEERVQQQFAAVDKTNPEPPLRLAELMMARDAGEPAEGQLLEAVDRAPNSAEPQLRLARLRAAKGVLYEAADAYRAAAKGEGAAAEEAKKEGAELEKQFKLPTRKAKGGPDAVYNHVAASLNEFFQERRKAKPALHGQLKLRVRIGADGVVKGVDVVNDTVGDALLTAHVYFQLKDASYPKQKREPVFEFELKGAKGK